MRQFIFILLAALALPAVTQAEEARRGSRPHGRSRDGGARPPSEAGRPVTSPGGAAGVVPPGNAGRAVVPPGDAGWKPRFEARPARGVGQSPIGLPPVGLELPSHELPPPHLGKKGHGRGSRPLYRHGGTQVVYLGYGYGYGYESGYGYPLDPVVEYYPAPAALEPARTARLILDVQPGNAQVFANGYYIGLAEDLRGDHAGADLAPGEHRIEVVAPGYERVTFDVKLAADQVLTYRQMLTPADGAPAPLPARAPAAAKSNAPATFYMIPGCYMGNVPPQDANLPSSCDVSKAVEKKY